MTELIRYDAARKALAEAVAIDEVKTWADKAEAMRVYARQAGDTQMEQDATEIRLRAVRRFGQLEVEMHAAGRIHQGGRPSKNRSENEPVSGVLTLKDLGVKKSFSSYAQKVGGIAEQAFEAMVARKRAQIAKAQGGRVGLDIIKEQEQIDRQAAHAAKTYDGGKVEHLHELTASGFKAGAILADPPWHFVTRSDKGEGRSASAHYTTDRRWKDVLELPVQQLAAKDATLHMWMVDWCPKLALEIIEAWGFAHKTTGFTWVKLTEGHDGKPRGEVIGDGDFHFGMGFWTRANPEDCWLATRGHPKRVNADVRQLIIHPVMEHSRKPDEIHDRIERLVGGPYLELYARRERSNWVTWGNELQFKMPTDANGGSLQFDPATGEIQEPEAQRDDTALTAAPARIDEESTASVMSPCTQGDGAAVRTMSPKPPQDSPVIDVPTFLRRGHSDCTAGKT